MWAPFVDHRGTRRQWLLTLQVTAVLGALGLAWFDPGSGYLWLLAAAFAFNVVAACQDVVTDGLAVRMLSPAERGLANGIQVGAYRFGMILGGGLLLYVFARAGWTTMFLCMAALLALTVLPALALREPANDRPAVRAGFKELAFGWMTRLKTPGVLVLIGLIAGYRFGDSMVASLIGPFMRDYGLTKESIALIKGTVGSLASLAAAILGGGFAYLVGRRTALFACGLAQTASLGFYVLAAFGIGGVAMIWAGNVAEHLLGGMATVAVFTLMMDASDPEHAGTDYTLFACAIVFVTGIANFTGASIADAFGYAPTFVLGMILSGIGCLVLVASLDARRGPARVAAVWHATPGRIAVEA